MEPSALMVVVPRRAKLILHVTLVAELSLEIRAEVAPTDYVPAVIGYCIVGHARNLSGSGNLVSKEFRVKLPPSHVIKCRGVRPVARYAPNLRRTGGSGSIGGGIGHRAIFICHQGQVRGSRVAGGIVAGCLVKIVVLGETTPK
jgi:hypothetical protein